MRSQSIDTIANDEDEVSYITAGQAKDTFLASDISVEPWQAERASLNIWRTPKEVLLAQDTQAIARDDSDG